jgi:toxin CptA
MLRAEIRASVKLASALIIAHAAAIVLAAAVLPNSAWTLGLCAVLVLNAGWTIWRHALLKHSGSAVALEFRDEAECNARLRSGQWLKCQILPSTYVTPLLIVLNLAHGGSWFARHVVIFPDSIAPDIHRRLRVRLRWSKSASGVAPPDGSL